MNIQITRKGYFLFFNEYGKEVIMREIQPPVSTDISPKPIESLLPKPGRNPRLTVKLFRALGTRPNRPTTYGIYGDLGR